MRAMVAIRLLGELELEADGALLSPPTSRRARSLLAWLALHPGLHPRGPLAARFWPEILDTSAKASLRSALWELRRSLGAAGDALLVATRERVGLSQDDGVWIDVAAFEELVRADRLEEALALWRGELLAGLDDDWVLDARDDYRQRRATALARLADQAEAAGDVVEAVAWTRRQVDLDPLGEEGNRDLIRRLAAAGDRPAALAAYARLRDRLRRELGIVPSPETRALVQALRAAEAVEPPEAAALVAPLLSADALPLVGRDAELAALRACWRSVRGGAGAAVAISGEAGIGKTRLVSELAESARAEGARVAVCAGLELGGGAPLGLWAELLRDLARTLPPPPAELAWPSELARLAPDLELRFGREPARAAGPAPELERARLFEAMVDLLEWAVRDRPLVLLMEDVHLADVASLELAAYAGRRISALPILLVLTRRDVPRRAEVDALLHALRSRGVLRRELALEALASASVAELARAVGSLSDSDVERVVAAAEGNALLAVESARALARGEDAVPATLRAAVRAACRAFAPETRLLAEFLAAAGRRLDRVELTALPLGELRQAAAEALETGLLTAYEGRLGFRHALLREAFYADLAEPQLLWLHETLAAALAELDDPEAPRRAAEVARHLRLAGRDDLAVDELARAAAYARSIGALPDAVAFLEEAVRLSPAEAGLLLELAEAEAWRGHRDAAEAIFARAIELLGDEDELALARAWLRRGRWLRGALCFPRESLASYRKAVGLLDQASLSARDERVEALAGCAWAEAIAGDVDEVGGLVRQLDDLVGPRGDDELLRADVALARSHALLRRGHFEDSYEPLVEAGATAERAGRPDMAYTAWLNIACAAACAGDFERALQFVDHGLATVRRFGLPTLEVHLLAGRAYILTRLGRLEDAVAASDAERNLAERLDDATLRATADHDRGMIALAAGEHEDAQALLAGALERRAPVSRPLARLARAEALVRLDRFDEAEAELRATALEPVAPSDLPDTLVPRLTRIQGLIAAARGDRELALQRLEEAAAGWRRHLRRDAEGDRYAANIVDLGRAPVLGLVDPLLELERIAVELEALQPLAT